MQVKLFLKPIQQNCCNNSTGIIHRTFFKVGEWLRPNKSLSRELLLESRSDGILSGITLLTGLELNCKFGYVVLV